MLAYPCPSCGQRLVATPERAGQRTICPKCLRSLVIPTLEQAMHGPDVDPTAPPPSDLLGPQVFDPITPPPRSAPGPATVAARRAAEAPAVVLPRSETVDVAAELTAALSMRMKPPPEPPSDLRLSTGLWLTLSLVAGALWLGAVAYDPALFPFVAVIGLAQVAAGYLWAALLAGRRSWVRGVVTLLPPVTLWRLFRPFGDNGFRPLRFVLTGLVIVGLAALGPSARSMVQPVVTGLEPVRVDPESYSEEPAVQLRAAAERKQPDTLLELLLHLARPEVVTGTPESLRPDTVAELRRLTTHARGDVRAAALQTLAVWAPAEARTPTLAALRTGDAAERKRALILARRWPDEEIARAVAARLTDRDDQHDAREVLLSIGGPTAESALLPMLEAEVRPEVRWMVIDLLVTVGGPRTKAALEKLSRTDPNDQIRERAAEVAAKLKG